MLDQLADSGCGMTKMRGPGTRQEIESAATLFKDRYMSGYLEYNSGHDRFWKRVSFQKTLFEQYVVQQSGRA